MLRNKTVSTIALTIAAALSLSACGGAGDGSTTSDALPKVVAPAGHSWSNTIAATADGFVMGNPDAPIKLVEFASLTCSHCAQFAAAASAPMKSEFIDTGRVSWEVRPFIRDPLDLIAATVVSCSGPERFFPLAENVFASQEQLFAGAQANPQATQTVAGMPEAQRFPALAHAWKLDEFFAARGIPAAEVNRCLADPAAITKRTESTERNARQYEITGTPTFLINGQVVADANEWTQIRDRLKAAGAR